MLNNWEINFDEDTDVWDDFVSRSPQRSIFVLCKFLASLKVGYTLVTCREKGAIVAGAVLLKCDEGEVVDGLSLFAPYQGILLADNSAKSPHSQITHNFKITEYFINKLTNNNRKLYLCQSTRFLDQRAFQWHNYNEPDKAKFKLDLRYTAVLDISKFSSFDDYLISVRSVRRQEFKKSSKSLKFEFSHDAAVLDLLHAKTFERQNIERGGKDSALIQEICKNSIYGGYGKLGIAFLDDVPVSAVLFLYDDRTAYYLFGANDFNYRNTFAGTFLLMKMIQNAFDEGVKELDFVGVNSPNRGDFKISFNGELHPYYVSTYCE